MAKDSSATVRSETPHLGAAIKRRAQDLINNKSIDTATRTLLCYWLEIDDPLLPDLVRRVDAGEPIIDDAGFLQIEEWESVASERSAGRSDRVLIPYRVASLAGPDGCACWIPGIVTYGCNPREEG